ncbi:MAG: radical SAM protein [Vicinamibacteria bacterium]|jgi:pyruvate formate lyase activating enzyme|nr:radical SAM protein [Vicinamibacteria bacterium]
MSRRDFLKSCSAAALGGAGVGLTSWPSWAAYPVGLREARYYTKLAGGQVQCELCPCSPICSKDLLTSKRLTTACNGGRLVDGQTCVCNVRTNIGGKLYVTNYGRAGMLAPEPIEKNPLHHFLPGLRALTVSAPGCSLACKGCQNWQIALAATDEVATVDAPPARVVDLASQEGCKALAFTYSEPMMYYEYLMDIARLGREQGLLSTVVSGGYVNPAPVREMCSVVDAFSVSVKALNERAYLDYARGKLSTIQKTMETIKHCNRWLESNLKDRKSGHASIALAERLRFLRLSKERITTDAMCRSSCGI